MGSRIIITVEIDSARVNWLTVWQYTCNHSLICLFSEYGTDLSPLVITVALLGKAAITISFAIIILYTKEIFPTNLRYVIFVDLW